MNLDPKSPMIGATWLIASCAVRLVMSLTIVGSHTPFVTDTKVSVPSFVRESVSCRQHDDRRRSNRPGTSQAQGTEQTGNAGKLGPSVSENFLNSYEQLFPAEGESCGVALRVIAMKLSGT